MGSVLTADPAPVGSDYNNWRLFRATSRLGPFTLLNQQLLTDLTFFDATSMENHFYRFSYFDSVGGSEGPLSEPFRLIKSYTTVEKVRSILQISEITDSTKPNIQEIQELITESMDEIDTRTGHAWRLRFSGTESGGDTTARFEFYDVTFGYEYQTGIPIYLQHRQIVPLDASEGDAFDIWNGSEYEDWLAKEEDRDGDWHGQYEQGVIYVRARWGVRGPIKARFKYRWGDTFVNGIIQKICTRMVAIEVLTGMDARSDILQEGTSGLTHDQRVKKWQTYIDLRLTALKEFGIPRTHMMSTL